MRSIVKLTVSPYTRFIAADLLIVNLESGLKNIRFHRMLVYGSSVRKQNVGDKKYPA